MKKAGLLTIGNEILRGEIVDTNSSYFSRILTENGIDVIAHLSIADDKDTIIKSFKMLEDCDIIISTGGLGPTIDDMSSEAFAEYLDVDLEFNEEAWEMVKSFFTKLKINMSPSNRKQAMIPQGCQWLNNTQGTAPGVFYFNNDKAVLLLPGPPAENQIMFGECLSKLEELKLIDPSKIAISKIRVYGIGEGSLMDLLGIIDFSEVNLGVYFSKRSWIDIVITNNNSDSNIVKTVTDACKSTLDENDIYYTEAVDINKIVFKMLTERKLRIAFAESLTGGAVGSYLVEDLPGVSGVFDGTIVAYSNALKKEILGVKSETLEHYGAVSEQTVREMAQGAANKTKADVIVALTGIAGPGGGSPVKPVGLVHFAFIVNNEVFHYKKIFSGNRSRVINKCVTFVYSELHKLLS